MPNLIQLTLSSLQSMCMPSVMSATQKPSPSSSCTCMASAGSAVAPGVCSVRPAALQVIEARNLSFPGNNIGPFGVVDTYVAVLLESEAGVITAHTPSDRRHLTQPKWQHDLSFPDAMLSHAVTFAISCHRRLSSSIIIGQVGTCVQVLLPGGTPQPMHLAAVESLVSKPPVALG